MNSLTVLYDQDCGFCCRARNWLRAQRQLVPLEFVAAGSADARTRFPVLDHSSTLRQLTVVADSGEVYSGDNAFLVCLWALTAWRSMANRKSRFVAAATRVADRLRANSLGRENDACGVDRCA